MVKFHLTSIANICIAMVLEGDNTLYRWSLSFQTNLTKADSAETKPQRTEFIFQVSEVVNFFKSQIK